MEIGTFLEKASELISLDELTQIAGNKAAAGDDIAAAFQSQAQLRSRAMSALLDGAQTQGRDLLADEQRKFDRLEHDRQTVFSLLRHVEARTATAYVVPTSQMMETRTTDTGTAEDILTREQPMAKWLEQRRGYAYEGERGALRFGAVVRAFALNDRRGLSPLELRVLAEGTGSGGGFLVPEILSSQFIDRVRDRLVVQRAGARIVPMTSETLSMARLAQPGATPGPSWKLENAPIIDSDLVLERVQLRAHTLTGMVKLSVELAEDANGLDAMIENELSQDLALKLDKAALIGSGVDPEPKGVLYQSGVTLLPYSAVTPYSYDFLIAAVGEVWSRNFIPSARIYNAQLAVRLAALKLKMWSGDTSGQQLPVPPVIATMPQLISNQIPTDGSPESTYAFVGDFSELMIGMRTSFKLEVSRVAGDAFQKLQVSVRAYLRADIALSHPEAFCVVTNVANGFAP